MTDLIGCPFCDGNITDVVNEAVAARIAALEAELAEALSRVDDLEREAGTVSAEFEGDCWKAMRRLLDACQFPWRDIDMGDGISADDAEEHIQTTIDELEKDANREKARAAAAEARAEKMAEALRSIAANTCCDGCQEAALVARAALPATAAEPVPALVAEPGGAADLLAALQNALEATAEPVAPCNLPDPSASDCKNMKEVGGGFEGERYRCAVCGKGYFLDYEDMK